MGNNSSSERSALPSRGFIAGMRIALVAVLSLTLALLLTSCSSKDERELLSRTEDTLQAVQELDEATLTALLDAAWFYPDAYGISRDCFIETYFADFSYEVEDAVTLESGEVWVTGVVQAVPGSELQERLLDIYTSGVESLSGGSVEEGVFDDYFVETCESEPMGYVECEFTAAYRQLDSGEWVMDEQRLAADLLGGLDPKQEEF